MSTFNHVSLISGFVPPAVAVLSVASLGMALVTRDRSRWRLSLLLAVAVGAGVVVIGLGSGIEHNLGSSFPRSFYLWSGLPLYALALMVVGWGRSSAHQRAAAAAALLFCLALGADQIDRHYAYLPTVGDLLGRPVEDQVAGGTVALSGSQVAKATATSATAASPSTIAFPAREHGVIISVAIPAPRSGFRARPALVWLPPAYFRVPRPRLPVIMLLAGVPGDPTNMIRAGHANRPADAYAAAHDGMAPILVFPDENGHFTGDTECVDGTRGNAETYLTSDVPAFIEASFSARTAPRSWAIVGFSEGGTCADTLALRHPERFSAFVDISGERHPSAAHGPKERTLTIRRLYGGNIRQWQGHDPLVLAWRARRQPVAACFVAGQQDRAAIRTARWLDRVLRHAGLRSEVRLVPGGHSFGTVEQVLPRVIPALAESLDLQTPLRTPCGPWQWTG